MGLPRVFVIGDSISVQYGPYLERYLARQFVYARKTCAEPGLHGLDVPQDANAGDSSQVLLYLRTMQQAGGIKADLLLLNCGLHDLRTNPVSGAKQVPLAQYVDNLGEIVLLVQAMGREPVWMRTTPCDEKVHNTRDVGFHRYAADCRAYNEAADRVMADAGVESIDLYNFTLNQGPDLYCDHVHFHEHIREKQAAYIAGWLEAWSNR
jgi:hypothetical protein